MEITIAIPILIIALNFIIYVGATWITFGVLPSISDSFYFWDYKLGRGWGYIFTIFCWILGFPLVMLASIMPENFQWIAFLAGSGFGFVGAACLIKDPNVMEIHGKAAAVGIIASLFLAGISVGSWAWIVIGIGVLISIIIALCKKIENKIWWVEITSFLSVIIPLVYRFVF